MRRVAVLGSGSWGTALAVHLGRIGHEVRLWARDAALAAEIAERRANAVYLPDTLLPDSVLVTELFRRTAVAPSCEWRLRMYRRARRS